MTDALILWALGRSKKLRGLAQVYQSFLLAKSGAPVPVDARGIHLDGEIYDWTGGTIQKRAK